VVGRQSTTPMPTQRRRFILNGDGSAGRFACALVAPTPAERARAGAGLSAMAGPIAQRIRSAAWLIWPRGWNAVLFPAKHETQCRHAPIKMRTIVRLSISFDRGSERPWGITQAHRPLRLSLRIPGPPPRPLAPVSPRLVS